MRIGIGAPPNGWAWPDFVLSKFTKDEMPTVEQAIARAAEAVVAWARDGVQTCMNRYNG